VIDLMIKADAAIHWKLTTSCTHTWHTTLANKNG